MKTHFSVSPFIYILREAEVGVLNREICLKHASPVLPSIYRKRKKFGDMESKAFDGSSNVRECIGSFSSELLLLPSHDGSARIVLI